MTMMPSLFKGPKKFKIFFSLTAVSGLSNPQSIIYFLLFLHFLESISVLKLSPV